MIRPIQQAEPPLDPDAPEARRWLEEELAKPEYRAAEPTAFDLAAQAVRDWFVGLFENASFGLPPAVIALIAVVVLAVLVVVALLVFGVPRLQRRSAAPVPLFDDEDLRSRAELRRAAAAAAASGDWALAIEEQFRALVRGLVDREVVRVHPGSTAQAVARDAGRAFSIEADALRDAAASFDGVRYLGRVGDADAYAQISALDERMSGAGQTRSSATPPGERAVPSESVAR